MLRTLLHNALSDVEMQLHRLQEVVPVAVKSKHIAAGFFGQPKARQLPRASLQRIFERGLAWDTNISQAQASIVFQAPSKDCVKACGPMCALHERARAARRPAFDCPISLSPHRERDCGGRA